MMPLAGQLSPLGRAVGAVAAFAPTDIAGLKLWIKADAGLWQDSAGTIPATLDTDPVGQWSDQSGQGNHAIQATSTKRPLLKLAIQNGLPVLRFDGTDDYLKTGAFTLNQPVTVFLVAKEITTAGGFYRLFDGNLQNAGALYRNGGAGMTMYSGSNGPAIAMTSGFHVWCAVFNGASSTLQKDNGAAATGNPGAGSMGGFTVAATGTPIAASANIDAGEYLVYSGALSGADITSVSNYLKARWATP